MRKPFHFPSSFARPALYANKRIYWQLPEIVP